MTEDFSVSALAYNLSRSGDVLLGSRSEGSVGISTTMQAGDVWACDSKPLTKTTTVVAQTVLDHGFTTFPQGVPTLGYLKGRIVGRVSPGTSLQDALWMRPARPALRDHGHS
jgi:hypothetical protein